MPAVQGPDSKCTEVSRHFNSLYKYLIPNLFDTSRSQVCLWFRFCVFDPCQLENRNKTKQIPESSKKKTVF